MRVIAPARAQAQASYYRKITDKAPEKTSTIQDIYELIRTDGELSRTTRTIQNRHAADIAANFPNGNHPYQRDKRGALSAVCFSGDIDRSAQAPTFRHNGRINFDLDRNPKKDLELFAHLVQHGYLPFFEATGLSISGFKKGHRWANAVVEIPEDHQGNYSDLEALHKRYYTAIGAALSNILILSHEAPAPKAEPFQRIVRLPAETLHLLKITSGHRLNIDPGHTNDLKRPRYLTADAQLIVRDAQPVTYEDLGKFETLHRQEKGLEHHERKASGIIAQDVWDFCRQFCTRHGFDFIQGQRNEYLSRYCIAANLLGVPLEDVEAHISSSELSEHRRWRDTLRGTYRRYRDSFGRWEGRVKVKQHAFLPLQVEAPVFMQFPIYLEDNPQGFEKVLDRIGELRRPLLIVPTGSGKTYSTIGAMRNRLKKQHPDKVFIFLSPLKAITQQVGIGTDMQIICEGHTSATQAAFEDSISTVKSFVDWCEAELYACDRLKDVILVFDEAHELITGADYQRLHPLPAIFDRCHKVIGLTATPLKPLVERFGFEAIRCERIHNPRVNIVYKAIQSGQLYKEVGAIQKAHKSDKVLVFHNSKAMLEKLAKAARRQGIKADHFHADLKKDSATYRHLIETGTLPEGTDHLFTTKILGFGTSFKGIQRIVYIAKSGQYDFLEFLQTYARLRENVIEVTVLIQVPKNPTPDRYRLYDFHRQNLEYKTAELQPLCDTRNRFDINQATHGGKPLEDNLPKSVSKVIKKCPFTRRYEVYLSGLLQQQYDLITHSLDADDFIRLLHTVPNSTVTEDTGQAAISAAEQAIIDQVEADHKQQEISDLEALHALMIQHPDKVLTYVYNTTDDLRLKQRITERLPHKADDLTLEEKVLIDRRWKRCETAARRYLELTGHYFATAAMDRIVELCLLKSGYKYGQERRRINSLENIARAEAGQDVEGAAMQDATGAEKLRTLRAHQQLIRWAQERQGKQQTADELWHQAKTCAWYAALHLNKKTLTEEIGLLFDLRRRKSGDRRFIVIGHRLSLDEVLGHSKPSILYREESSLVCPTLTN